MTAPVMPCICRTAHLGHCTATLTICLQPGLLFDSAIQLINKISRLPVDWPAGMAARLVFTWGTGTGLTIPAVMDNSWMRFSMTGAETEMVPRGAHAAIELNYTGAPDDWRAWVEGCSQC